MIAAVALAVLAPFRNPPGEPEQEGRFERLADLELRKETKYAEIRDAEADFFGVAFGVEGEEAGEDFVAEVGGPEQAALIGVVVLVGLVEEDRRGARGEVVPAIGFEHGAVHGGVQLAQLCDL